MAKYGHGAVLLRLQRYIASVNVIYLKLDLLHDFFIRTSKLKLLEVFNLIHDAFRAFL